MTLTKLKLRNTAGATLAAFALVLSMSGSAQAAHGEFHYKYVDDGGQEQHGNLHNPRNGDCINLYGVDSDDILPGVGPHNSTDTWVTVYLGVNCEGPQWRLKPNGRQASDRLDVRSVRFDADAEAPAPSAPSASGT